MFNGEPPFWAFVAIALFLVCAHPLIFNFILGQIQSWFSPSNKIMIKAFEDLLEESRLTAELLLTNVEKVAELDKYVKTIKPLLEEINKQLDNVDRLEGCIVVDESYLPKNIIDELKSSVCK